MNFYTYIHRRNDTGAIFYVGKGCGKRAFSTSDRNNHWERIFNKVGRSVEFLVKDVDEEFSFFVEEEVIDLYRRRGIQLVNYTDGGDGVSGYKHSPETCKKMSGRAVSLETRAKMSAIRKGRKSSPETIAKMVSSRKWYSHTTDTRKKMSDLKKGCVAPPDTLARLSVESSKASKAVLCVTTGEEFKSLGEAARHFGTHYSSVSKCCSGVLKTTHGHVFRFLNK